MNWAQQISTVLKRYWGYDHFRPSQEAIILAVLEGNDTLALLPTGGGKSICFQVPALAKDGICIVISPLIALMKDQVQNLKAKGIAAEAIYSGMHSREVDRILDNCIYGGIKFLYVSPERLSSELFRVRLEKMNVNLLAVDEAHCISQWGYDFRPPYLQIAEVRSYFPDVPIMALTATATAEVRRDIVQQLKFKKESLFINSFARPNLTYIVQQEEEKMERLIQLFRKISGTGIVYVRSRKLTREIAEWLRNHGISVDFYHAGLSLQERNKKQESWIKNKIRVIVATNAFGMGIDKPDVRLVVHIDLPDSLEAYYQEAGRGGRDGLRSYGVLLFNPDDCKTAQNRITHFNPEPEQIRAVYEALGHYYQLPIGSGIGESFDFDIADFCTRFKQDPNVVLRALQLLEQHNYLTPSDAVYLPSRLRFLVDKSVLYAFEIENKKLEPLIKCLLRNYALFDGNYAEINEQAIATQLKITLPELHKQLQLLQQFALIEFLPKKNAPQLYFNQGRQKAEELQLNVEQMNRQKAAYQKRLEGVINYAVTKTKCRSRLLLAYFDEPISENCGTCDYCINLKKHALNTTVFEQITDYIEHKLTDQIFQFKLLQEQFPQFDPIAIENCLQWLLQEQLLLKKEHGFYKPPEIHF